MKLTSLIARNCKIYFRDKGVFFTSLIAPLILLFLFVVFLGGVFEDSLLTAVKQAGMTVEKNLLKGFSGGYLVSSLLAVSAVSIAFSANTAMVQDKVTGKLDDFRIAPVSRATLALGYYISTFLVTLAVCFCAFFVGLIYLVAVGWYLTAADVFLAALDTVLLVFFGTALSSLVLLAVKSQGGVTAIQVVVSASYGFLCGAYMPLASLAKALRSVLVLLPGTYGTSLLHEHFLGGAINAVSESAELRAALRNSFDCKLDFFGSGVAQWACFLVLSLAVVLLVAAFVLICAFKGRARKKV